MPEGRTRGQTTSQLSDAGGIAQHPPLFVRAFSLHLFSAAASCTPKMIKGSSYAIL
ncbi:hypothetical protein [uncultured Alloprevotella sp.]|uniref:hypothetical protein n=1 Tax=uncultured Alloprevotella sp. TaxID=1283315 RepID=UPI00325FD52C